MLTSRSSFIYIAVAYFSNLHHGAVAWIVTPGQFGQRFSSIHAATHTPQIHTCLNRMQYKCFRQGVNGISIHNQLTKAVGRVRQEDTGEHRASASCTDLAIDARLEGNCLNSFEWRLRDVSVEESAT
jgi:hypothetical protein